MAPRTNSSEAGSILGPGMGVVGTKSPIAPLLSSGDWHTSANAENLCYPENLDIEELSVAAVLAHGYYARHRRIHGTKTSSDLLPELDNR